MLLTGVVIVPWESVMGGLDGPTLNLKLAKLNKTRPHTIRR